MSEDRCYTYTLPRKEKKLVRAALRFCLEQTEFSDHRNTRIHGSAAKTNEKINKKKLRERAPDFQIGAFPKQEELLSRPCGDRRPGITNSVRSKLGGDVDKKNARREMSAWNLALFGRQRSLG